MNEIRDVLVHVLSGAPLSAAQTESIFRQMLSGAMDDAQIAGFLAMVQTRGATVDELVGATRVMRSHVTRVPIPQTECDESVVIDTCGTGGAPKTFNISTVAAIVTAAASPVPGRVMVAKHGNRSRTGRGSAEVLASLGVNVDAPVEVQSQCLAETGVCFCFAIHHHPATRHAIGARRSLGFPTMFNLLGPLTNPAGATRQLIGVYHRSVVEPVAETLARTGTERAMVVHSLDGLDELTLTAETDIAHVENGEVRLERFDPRSIGMTLCGLADLQAHELDEAAEVIRDVLNGAPGPKRDVTVLNTSAALVIAGVAKTLEEGCALAKDALDSGAAARTLERLADVTRRAV